MAHIWDAGTEKVKGVFGLVGKLINCRIYISKESLVLTEIYGLELDFKIAF